MRSSVLLAATDTALRDVLEPFEPEESALSLAVRAYLSACALRPGVLLSPMSILLAGFGARRAFDGRARQPGKGAPRPRGFREGEPIPDAARVAIPTNLVTLFVAWGYGEDQSRASIFSTAASLAKRNGGEARGSLLLRAAQLGAGAYRGSDVARELVRLAAPAHGGLVTEEDFEPPDQVDYPVSVAEGLGIPWNDPTYAAAARSILTTDRRGSAVAICYEDAEQGASLAGGQLICPLLAAPVLRGVPRVRPGEPLPQRCAARIDLDETASRVISVSSGALSLGVPS